MAAIKQCANIIPVYNDGTYVVYTFHSSLQYFNYIFELYINDESYPIHTSRVLPQQTTGYGLFNVNSILKSVMLSSGFKQNLYGVAISNINEYIIKYKLVVKYTALDGSPANSGTVDTFDNKYVYCGRYQLNQMLTNYDINNYLPNMSAKTQRILNTTNVFTKKVEMNDTDFISFFRYNPLTNDYITYIKIRVFTGGHADYTYYIAVQPWIMNPTQDIIQHFGCSPSNLNQLTASDVSSYTPVTFASFPIIKSTNTSYTIEFTDASKNVRSKTYTYYIGDECTKFDRFNVFYRTFQGGYDSIVMDGGLAQISTNINPTSYNKYIPYNYTQTSRGNTIYNNKALNSLSLTTRILDNDGLQKIYELIQSNDILINYYDGTQQIYGPAILEPGTYEYLTRQPQRLSQYQFNFIYSNKQNMAQ